MSNAIRLCPSRKQAPSVKWSNIANAAARTLSHMYTLARYREAAPEDCDPCRPIPMNPRRAREQFLTDAKFTRYGRILDEVSCNDSRISAGAVRKSAERVASASPTTSCGRRHCAFAQARHGPSMPGSRIQCLKQSSFGDAGVTYKAPGIDVGAPECDVSAVGCP